MTPQPVAIANVLTPRARRFSASFSNTGNSPTSSTAKVVPRVSQLRAEECPDLANAREASHEREVLNDINLSQSYEDLTLITENWSFRTSMGGGGAATEAEAFAAANPLHLNLTNSCCNSPSPTRLRLPHGLSPSPTRHHSKTFATRRSMSPTMRPSQLACSVKRKFELDDHVQTYSPPPAKKFFIDR